MVEARNIVENEKRAKIIEVLRLHRTEYTHSPTHVKEWDWNCSCSPTQKASLPSWDDCAEQTNRHLSDEILRALND